MIMKKLMFAAVTVAAMGAMAELASANVVGYQAVEAPTGDSMRCPTFKTVGGAGYDLTKITVTGGYGMGDVVAQTLSSTTGLWDGEYYWLTEENTGMPTGWYRDPVGADPVLEDDVVLDAGQALFVHSEYEDISLNCSGEVPAGDVDLTAAVGDGMVGNAVPVDTDLTGVTVTGGYGMGDVVAQSLSTATGLWDGEYYWLTEDNTGMPTGWYKDMVGADPVLADEVVLTPGESLFVHSEYEDITVTLPAVL